MGRKKKPGFKNPKMFSSRVELEDYYKFSRILQTRDNKTLQEMINLFVTEYISGNIQYKNDKFVLGEINE